MYKRRYEKMREQIALRFFDGKDPGNILSMSEAGDWHLNDCVRKLTLESGAVLYYKPRDCQCSDLLGDINELLFGKRMVPEQVSGDGYGFQKAVSIQKPASEQEFLCYAKRLGALGAVFTALGSMDMYKDNVVPSDGYPITIDAETVLYAESKEIGGGADFSSEYETIFPDLSPSVAYNMVLPRFTREKQLSPLYLTQGPLPKDSEVYFEQGFRLGCQQIRDKQSELFEILDSYYRIPIRFLTRTSLSYAELFYLYSLSNQACRDSFIEFLQKGLSEQKKKRLAPIVECELESIRQGEIPYFCALAGERDLRSGIENGILIPDFFEQSPIENAKSRIRRMNEDVQCAYIQRSFWHFDYWEKKDDENVLNDTEDLLPISAQEALAEVEADFCQLEKELFPLPQGGVFWHVPQTDSKTGVLHGLGEGFSGIAVFCDALAASDLISGQIRQKADRLAEDCLYDMKIFGEYLLDNWPGTDLEKERTDRFGGNDSLADNLSGYLWALKHLERKDPEAVRQLLSGFQKSSIQPPYGDDILLLLCQTEAEQEIQNNDTLWNGNARKAAELLLKAQSGSPDALDQAGKILAGIQKRKRSQGCCRVYTKNRRQYFLPGFLKGSTGIAYVMLRYAQLKQKN